MPDCAKCIRSRDKREPHLKADGYIECKASDSATEMMKAFNAFASMRKSEVPFVVVCRPGRPEAAWPFQFQADAIDRCDGFVSL